MLRNNISLRPNAWGRQSLEDLGIDSLTTIEFMFTLEDEFSIGCPRNGRDRNRERYCKLVDAWSKKSSNRPKLVSSSAESQ